MEYLSIDNTKLTEETARNLVKLCPFAAIVYENGQLSITAGCRMCKICVKQGGGIITLQKRGECAGADKAAWRGICVYADTENGIIHPVTFELLGKAKELAAKTAQPVYALLIGHNTENTARELLSYGADTVHVYDLPELANFLIEPYTAVFDDYIEKIKPSSILVGATNTGRSLAPRVAARRKTGLTADCTVLDIKPDTDLVQIRPAFGGNIMAQIVTPRHRPQFCTVRYKIFSSPKRNEAPGGSIVRLTIAAEKLASRTTILSKKAKPAEIDISDAEALIAVGRGLKNRDDLNLLEPLVKALGAQIACTRPLIENGWFDPKRQIGLSGRTVKPKIIITLGISGSVQFAAGMRNSPCIIAVNTDPKAPIFDVAHYGIIGDWYEILPLLTENLRAARQQGGSR